MKKSLMQLSALWLVLLLIGVVGCGAQQNVDSKVQGKDLNGVKVDPNATLVVGLKGPVLTLDPANYRDLVTESVLRNIFDGLVTTTPDGKVVPQVAESWKAVSPTVWEFKIRKGITFQDGSPLTVNDVKFTFDRLINEGAMDGKTSPRKGLLGPLKSVEVVDDSTVRFNFSSPWSIFLTMLPHQQIVPKAYLEKVGGAKFAEHPIGAGPFKYVEGKLDDKIVLERYYKYYGGSPDVPPVAPAQVKTLIFRVIPENSTRIASLMSGEIQIVQEVPTDMVPQLQANKNTEVKMTESTRMHMFEMNVKKAPFDKVQVRQALNYAINMQQIVDKVLNGYAVRPAGPVLTTSPALNKDLKLYPYDPEKAKQLLKDAGYPKGFPLVIDTEAVNQSIAQAAASDLQKIGIDASVRVWDWGVLKPLMLKGERNMVLTDWGNSTQDPSDLLGPTLRGDGRGNYSFYNNPEVNNLLDKADISVNDQERYQMYGQAQKIIYDEAPWVFGYVTKNIEATTKQVVNYQPSMDGMLTMTDVGILAK
ncbi:MAG: ABC transporter substrate-binding protein [Desulfitobacteriaceae bacterium]|nr:ABC transporter substrate-binding protein [Desulfitobacteriaceae bacterium]MDI6915454.1 ABC transporter substrate-binding protein [Desulfitobacteriaceae bacterium]